VTTGQHQGAAVVRPRHHVEAVSRDAARAADEIAAEDGAEPDYLIPDTISWALGERGHAPFTRSATPAGADRDDVDAEIRACIAFLESTPWSDDADDVISRAQHILKILQWLTGADDKPPTYCRETEPGDLVGGRGLIVRPSTEIRRMLQMAREKLAAGRTSHALGADWHQGVIATLEWVLGDRAESPVLGKAGDGPPDGPDIAIEQAEAEEHTTPPLRRAGIALHFADAVASTCRWLLGGTTQPPVTDDD
jgi:hypothetical protein